MGRGSVTMSSGLDWERFGVITGGDEVCILPPPTLSEKGVGIPPFVYFPKNKDKNVRKRSRHVRLSPLSERASCCFFSFLPVGCLGLCAPPGVEAAAVPLAPRTGDSNVIRDRGPPGAPQPQGLPFALQGGHRTG